MGSYITQCERKTRSVLHDEVELSRQHASYDSLLNSLLKISKCEQSLEERLTEIRQQQVSLQEDLHRDVLRFGRQSKTHAMTMSQLQ